MSVDMKISGIVGTAGHVDHGKTCLIQALTNIDTDRLPEEKKRGITIDLGFAYLYGSNDSLIGIVDVPGHEKFIKNMLAGIGGLDLVLLVVAADEGIMPQTVEHFEIVNKIGIKKGIIVVTKSDLVDEEWLEMVHADIDNLVKGTFLERADRINVSAYTGQNIDKLKQMLFSYITESVNRNYNKDSAYMPIDRCFTVDGFGSVLTGTLQMGCLQVGDDLEIFPLCHKGKIRRLEVHGRSVDKAYAGQRVAVNITGVKKTDIKRGMVLAALNSIIVTDTLLVVVEMFEYCQHEILNNSRLHFYCGAAESLCRINLLGKGKLSNGDKCYARLVFEKPIALKRNDRFILRFYSPLESVAGGKVLDVQPPKQRKKAELLSYAEQIDCGDSVALINAFLSNNIEWLISSRNLRLRLGLSTDIFEFLIKSTSQEGSIKIIGNQYLIHALRYEALCKETLKLMHEFHELNPLVPGMSKEELKSRLRILLPLAAEKSIDSLMEHFIESKLILVNGYLVMLPDFEIKYSDTDKMAEKALLIFYKEKFLQPTPLDEFITDLNLTNVTMLAENAVARGKLKKVASMVFMDMEAWHFAKMALIKHFEENEKLTLAEFRDQMNISRKYAMLILEAMDREKFTKKVNDYRIKI